MRNPSIVALCSASSRAISRGERLAFPDDLLALLVERLHVLPVVGGQEVDLLLVRLVRLAQLEGKRIPLPGDDVPLGGQFIDGLFVIEGHPFDLLALPLLDRFHQPLVILPRLVQFRGGRVPLRGDCVPRLLEARDPLRVILVETLDVRPMVGRQRLELLLAALLGLDELLGQRLALAVDVVPQLVERGEFLLVLVADDGQLA